jgi:TATA-box binding protein (TBP) (component of TFIID and TFIIIB)
MPTTLESKNLDQLLAEADELIEKINSEFLEDLEEEHRLQFEKHTQRLQQLKSAVQVKAKGKGTVESFSSAEGMHEAVLDIIKAMKELARYFA